MIEKILIVDDEKNIRITLNHALKEIVKEIDLAENGFEAIEKLKIKKYDVVLLDNKMPKISGMQVLEFLSENKIQTSVIMMTAYGTIEKAVEAMKLGAVDFIRKPFDLKELTDKILEIQNRKNLQEENIETFEEYISFAKKMFQEKNFLKAKYIIQKSLSLSPESPIPHNLLGIICEYERDFTRAQNHYRAALALDPTYNPAQMNLERTSQFIYTKKGINLGL